TLMSCVRSYFIFDLSRFVDTPRVSDAITPSLHYSNTPRGWQRPRFYLVFMAVLGFLVAPVVPAAVISNVLLNAGFEEGSGTSNADWFPYGNVYRMDEHPRSGGYAAKMYGGWWPPDEWNYSGARQIFPAVASQMWEARAWVSTWSDDPLGAGNQARLIIWFRDAGSNVLLTITSSDILNTANTNTWAQLVLRGCAPPGTADISFSPSLGQPTNHPGGSAWFDDCELGLSTVTSLLTFAGQNWAPYNHFSTPGPNYFSTNCVWVDENGWLHLAIRQGEGKWLCGEVYNLQSPGYGEYRWTVGTRMDWVSPDTVLGLFTFEATKADVWNEIDFEFTRTFNGMAESNLQYAIQPWFETNALHQAMMVATDEVSTHSFVWTPSDVRFVSYWGDEDPPPSNRTISSWTYAGPRVPVHSNECVNMNLYLWATNAPLDTQRVEVIIRDFRFTPFSGFYLLDDFEDGVRSNAWMLAGWWPPYPAIEETNGVLRVSPLADWETGGYLTTEPMNWNDKGEWFEYSAMLSTVSVQVARAGPDVRSVIELCSEPNNAWMSSNAVALFGLYDEAADSLQFIFQTKTNRVNNDGDTRFDATLTGVTPRLAEGRGIEMKIALGQGQYRLHFLDGAGNELPLTTNIPGREGPHHLGRSLDSAHWLVGAMNQAEGRGTVEWTAAKAGVQTWTTSRIEKVEINGGGARLQWPVYYGRTYSVERATNLQFGFETIANIRETTPPFCVFTGLVNETKGYYRLRM
ncbi:MAG: glycoside hydrolase family 16 protein, partial [Lentisphaerota bacterium]